MVGRSEGLLDEFIDVSIKGKDVAFASEHERFWRTEDQLVDDIATVRIDHE